MARYNYEFDMKYTDNPYIDLIVNCVKILGMNCVVKNENQALHYEDARSATLAGQYIKYKEGNWNYIKDGEYSDASYMEWNSYYRMLNGLPPAYTLNDENAYFSATGYDDSIYVDIGNAYVIPELYEKYFIDVGQYDEKYEGKYLHELNTEDLSVISVEGGILDQIKADYAEDPHYQYIYHLGDKRVDFYTARKAVNFAMLYCPSLNTFDIIENKFKRMYDRNRRYTMSTVYSEAYRFMSYHYDAFIQILIIIQTMVDMISEVQEYIINKDVFDSRTIRYLFESYGIAYYKEIPTKYQIRIIKNVNTLLKYKSSHRNITDILELFDDDTITVFTYYLMKIKAINRDNFYYYEESDINPRYVNTDVVMYVGRPEDISNNKVPLMNVHTNQDDITVTKNDDGKVTKENFIRTYLYNYYLIDEGEPDTASNRAISMSDSQPIVSKYAETIDIATDTINNGSFVLDFLNTVALNNKGLPWFGTDNYNIDESKPSSKEYLANRNVFLNRYKNALTNLIRIVFNEETADDSFALNQYNFRRIKYRLYSILGIFDYDGIAEKFNNRTLDDITDAELESLFYTADTLITEKYCNTHGIESLFTDFLESDDRYILNHTIPFMVWNEYKYKDASDDPETTEYYTSDNKNYIFNSDGSFSANYNKLGDLYTKYTKAFRESYIISTRVFIEAVFDDMAYDSINNPTPRYTGWMDISQVVSKTGKSLDELELGDEITIHTGDNVPIYKSAYVYEVITKDMLGLEYYRKNYDLCFLKVPILDPNAYAVIERRDLRRSYDSITLADPFWDGVSTFDLLTDEERDKLHQSKKQEILNKDFTIERTKYIAVEANIDLVKMSYQVSYFMNMLYDKHMDEEDLMVEVDSEISDDKVRLNDLLTFAIALNFIYNGTEPDNIASDMEKNMYINGFNFDTDWSTIYNYLENKCYINNNYDNEIHEYTYIDEFGVSHTNVGYGMDPMGKGWLTEIYDDTVSYGTAYCSDEEDYVEVKAYFGYPIYGYNENNEPIFSYSDEENQPTGSPINNRIPMPPDSVDHSKVPDPAVGAFLSGRYEQCSEDCATTIDMELDFGSSEIWNYNLKHHPLVSTTGELTVLNIAWEPTQYPDSDNNSHGLWLDTEILTTLTDESITDLDKINYLKKIYYSNTNLYDHLTYMLRHAESKRMYDIYKVLFDSFMETKMNHDYYGQIDRNGNPVYTNENDTSELYYLTLSDEVECDPNGFPIFEGTDLETNKVAYYQFDYKKAVETNFKVCEYYNIANPSEVYDCFYNMRTINGEEVKEYIVHYDEQNQLGRETYFFPSSENHFFTFNVNEQNYLVYNDNPSIKIPVDLDSDGNVIIDENKKYVIIEDEDGNYTVEIVDKSEKVTNGKEVIITKKIAESYYDFLEYRNPSLYALLIDLKYNYDNVPVKVDDNDSVVRYMPSDEKKKRIETLCELIVEALEKYFDKSEWRYLFNLIPTANIENIQNYIMKMVVFFKSWKTQILDTTVSYIIDDPYNNHVHILDDMYYNTTFDNLLEKVRPKEYKYFENHTVYKDPIKVGEDLQMNDVHYEPYTIDFGFAEKIYGHRFDYPNLTSKLIFKDKIGPSEKLEMNTVYYTGEVQQDSNGNILLP